MVQPQARDAECQQRTNAERMNVWEYNNCRLCKLVRSSRKVVAADRQDTQGRRVPNETRRRHHRTQRVDRSVVPIHTPEKREMNVVQLRYLSVEITLRRPGVELVEPRQRVEVRTAEEDATRVLPDGAAPRPELCTEHEGKHHTPYVRANFPTRVWVDRAFKCSCQSFRAVSDADVLVQESDRHGAPSGADE